jgi:diketogulonate reductase-like aldo/keto reductase
LAQVADRRESSPAAIALAWTIRSGRVITIPESGSPAHVRQDAAALSLRLTDQDLDNLPAGYRHYRIISLGLAPCRQVPLGSKDIPSGFTEDHKALS